MSGVSPVRSAASAIHALIQDSYFHGTNLWPDVSNLAHASSVRMEQGLTLRHNSIHCSFTGPFINDEIGCSADLTGYPDFTPIKNNTVDGNLFMASPGSGFCAYGGASPRQALLRRPDERHEPEVHQQRVPARRQQQVRHLRAGDQLQHEPSGERLVGQRVGQRDGGGSGDVRAMPTPGQDRSRAGRSIDSARYCPPTWAFSAASSGRASTCAAQSSALS